MTVQSAVRRLSWSSFDFFSLILHSSTRSAAEQIFVRTVANFTSFVHPPRHDIHATTRTLPDGRPSNKGLTSWTNLVPLFTPCHSIHSNDQTDSSSGSIINHCTIRYTRRWHSRRSFFGRRGIPPQQKDRRVCQITRDFFYRSRVEYVHTRQIHGQAGVGRVHGGL